MVPSDSSEEEGGWNASTIVPGSHSQQHLSWIEEKKILHAIFLIAHPLPTLPEQCWNAGWDTDPPSQAGEHCVAFRDKPMEKAKINFDWPLDLLRSETVKVYVNNEINILVLF